MREEGGGAGGDMDFLDALLRSKENVKKGNEMLLKAVRTFEN